MQEEAESSDVFIYGMHVHVPGNVPNDIHLVHVLFLIRKKSDIFSLNF